jgi:hypothetical protein
VLTDVDRQNTGTKGVESIVKAVQLTAKRPTFSRLFTNAYKDKIKCGFVPNPATLASNFEYIDPHHPPTRSLQENQTACRHLFRNQFV